MSEPRRCGNCRWWLRDPVDQNNLAANGGTCHGGPPTAIIVISRGPVGPVQQLTSAWPPVSRDELPCGMHQPMPGKVLIPDSTPSQEC